MMWYHHPPCAEATVCGLLIDSEADGGVQSQYQKSNQGARKRMKRIKRNNMLTAFTVVTGLLLGVVQARAQAGPQIDGGYELNIKAYKDAKKKLDKELRNQPTPVSSPVTPKEVKEMKDKQNELGQKLKENPDDETVQDQFEGVVKAKYAKLRQALDAEVTNAAKNIAYDKRVIPLLQDFVGRGEQFRKLAEDQRLSPEKREEYRKLHRHHMGGYARYQKRIRERRNNQAQRLKLALVNARGGFDRFVLPNDELLKIIGDHTEYADALQTEFVNDLKGWLGIGEQLKVLIDNLEIRELVEGLTGQGMSNVTTVSRKLAERRQKAVSNIHKLYTMVAGPVGNATEEPDGYGDEQIEEMVNW
jgi:hypothetical protein